MFTVDHHFRSEVNQALQTLADPGLITEVHHFQALEALCDSILKQEWIIKQQLAKQILEMSHCRNHLKHAYLTDCLMPLS
jgi:hypothetical protein